MADFFDDYGPSFLGLQILRLFNEIDRGGTEALAAESSGVPSRLASALVFLAHHGPSSASDLARALNASHQLVSQRVAALLKRELALRQPDPQDARRSLIALTDAGKRAAREVAALCRHGDQAYRILFEEIGVDLFASVVKARKALAERSLAVRIRDVAERAS